MLSGFFALLIVVDVNIFYSGKIPEKFAKFWWKIAMEIDGS